MTSKREVSRRQVKSRDISNSSTKIRDDVLQRFMRTDTEEIMQVLIEVEAPEPTVTYQRQFGDGNDAQSPYSVEFPIDAAEAERDAVETTRSRLDSMNIRYRFSPSARVFAVGVTPGQLQKLIVEASVRSIVPNRHIAS